MTPSPSSSAPISPLQAMARRLTLAIRHRSAPRLAMAAAAICLAASGAAAALSGAKAQADTPPPSQGRLLKVVVATRAAPDPAPIPTAYTLLPTVSADPQPDATLASAIPLDPDLAAVESVNAVQRYLDREARDQATAMAEIARINARAERTLSGAPAWPMPAETPSAVAGPEPASPS